MTFMADPQICDGCERSRPGCVSVGEEVLCAECILARASSAQEAVLSHLNKAESEIEWMRKLPLGGDPRIEGDLPPRSRT